MMILIILTAVFQMLTPIFSANAIGLLTERSYMTALYFAIGLLVARILVSSISAVQNIYYAKIDAHVKLDLKNRLITSITNVTMAKNDQTNSGIYIERVNEDITKCSDVIMDILLISVDLISNIAFLVYIAFLNIYFFIVLVAYISVIWILDSKKEKVWYRDRKKVKTLRELATGLYVEQIRGLRDVKNLNIRQNTITEAGSKYSVAVLADRNSRYTRSKISLIRNICAVIFEAGFIIMGIFFIMEGWISLTVFLIIYMYHGNVRMVTQFIAMIKEYAMEGELSSQRVFEIIEQYPKETFGNQVLESVIGEIIFKDVNFSYNEQKQILKDINLTFSTNKTTAIVGKSGSGKSTILALMNRLYDINSGEILVDGVNIKELTEDSLRDNIGVVTQSPYIFNCTIKENLALVKPDATEEEMINALKRAQIYDFVEKLEKGLDSLLGENGVLLSGGQRQRISIARILLKNSKVIILDEATSALDNESQEKIVDVINDLKKDHTIIIVAHRLSTIVGVDKIIVLDDGIVICEGTHRQLMKKCKIYKDLYEKEEEASSSAFNVEVN
jgi:ABC-type multidrug transport system fused ATPase/permease subunit